MSSLLSRIRTPLYHNTGSVARDHLASERTFLAWIRTGLGFIALGIAIERFSQLDLSELLQDRGLSHHDSQIQPLSRHEKKGANHEGHQKQQSDLLVGSLLGCGSASIAYGSSRYFVNLRLLERGFFKPAYHGPALLSVFVAGLAGGVYWNTLQDRQGSGEGRDREYVA